MAGEESTELSPTLGREILAAHEACCQAAQSAILHARTAGELLIQAKAALPHGTWLRWLGEHCPTIPERTGRAYMQIARRWSELEADRQHVADLPVRRALALLAEPREVDEADDDGDEFGRLAEQYRAELESVDNVIHEIASTFNGLCDEADADEAALAALQERSAQLDAAVESRGRAHSSGLTPMHRRRSRQTELLREAAAIQEESRQLWRCASQRRLRFERALGQVLAKAASEGWTWASEVLAMDDEAFEVFLGLCETRIAGLEATP